MSYEFDLLEKTFHSEYDAFRHSVETLMELRDANLRKLQAYLRFHTPSRRQLIGAAVGAGAIAGVVYYVTYPRPRTTDEGPRNGLPIPDLKVDEELISEIRPRMFDPLPQEAVTEAAPPSWNSSFQQPVFHAGAEDSFAGTSLIIPPKLEQALFCSPTIAISDPQRLRRIIHNLIEDGDHRLQIITDFDYTLTRYAKNGEPCDNTYHVIEKSLLMPPEYRNTADILRTKYLAMQEDPALTPRERETAMEEWLIKSFELMKRYKIKESDIPACVTRSNAMLRAKVPIFLSKVSLRKVPITIFSTGLAAVVREILEHHVSLSDNISIIGNELVCDSEGCAVATREPLIQGGSKLLLVASRAEYFAQYKSRQNIILIGDSLADAQLAASLPNDRNMLKIGFLVKNFEGSIDLYKEAYDIVIVDQENFGVVHDLVEFILGAPNKLSSVWELERNDRERGHAKLW